MGRAGKWRDPRPCPHHPAGLPGPFPKKLGTQALLEPQQPALPSSERPEPQGPGGTPALSLLKPHVPPPRRCCMVSYSSPHAGPYVFR